MRALSNGGKLLIGLCLGLSLAELAFRARSGGAFPHLNIYEHDPELGVRLSARAALRLGFSGNPITRVTTNRQGLRGADWPATSAEAKRDVLVVGDSQVFGLGVEDSQTFAAQLGAAIGNGGRVLNAGVPTYGPLEYTALVERLVAERKPARVVYVINMANDLFELERPNRERHAVWDGWAVRAETAPRSTLEFPGRHWLMSQSHAVYALRAWLRGFGGDDVQLASEGGFHDILARSQHTTVAAGATKPGFAERMGSLRAQLAGELAETDAALLVEFSRTARRDRRYVAAMRELGLRGDPLDIVQPLFTESARPVRATALHLLVAALALDKNSGRLEALAQEAGHSKLLAHIQQRRTLRERLARSATTDEGAQPAPNTLDAILARTRRACDEVQAEMMVVILPLDVQVSPEEWQKYGQSPLDMSPTAALNLDVAARAKRLGMRVLDATPALRAAEPGAFLKGDLHMSPRGHAALAKAIAEAWSLPLPPLEALPPERSALPAADEWRAVEPQSIPNTPEGCHLSRVREWWRVACRRANAPPFDEVASITLLRGGRGDAMADAVEGATTPRLLNEEPLGEAAVAPQLIAPILEGDVLEAQLGWSNLSTGDMAPHHARTLRIHWPRGAEPHAEWGPLLPPAAAQPITPKTIATIINRASIPHDVRCEERRWAPYHRALEAQDFDAVRDFYEEQKGERELQCQLGRPLRCDAGEVAFGVVGRCVPACSQELPCAQGSCVADRGRFGCILP